MRTQLHPKRGGRSRAAPCPVIEQRLAGAHERPSYCVFVPSRFGYLRILWHDDNRGPRVDRIALPSENRKTSTVRLKDFAGAKRSSCAPVDELAEGIQAFCSGEAVTFELAILDLDQCSGFQKRVLLAEYAIPRGWVSTYGRIARHLSNRGAARAVGNALANNPFPIVIPCHRAVRGNGALGGFRGGLPMKRAFLEFEGIEFVASGKVRMDKIHY